MPPFRSNSVESYSCFAHYPCFFDDALEPINESEQFRKFNNREKERGGLNSRCEILCIISVEIRAPHNEKAAPFVVSVENGVLFLFMRPVPRDYFSFASNMSSLCLFLPRIAYK